jgi:hypothetical protein
MTIEKNKEDTYIISLKKKKIVNQMCFCWYVLISRLISFVIKKNYNYFIYILFVIN